MIQPYSYIHAQNKESGYNKEPLLGAQHHMWHNAHYMYIAQMQLHNTMKPYSNTPCNNNIYYIKYRASMYGISNVKLCARRCSVAFPFNTSQLCSILNLVLLEVRWRYVFNLTSQCAARGSLIIIDDCNKWWYLSLKNQSDFWVLIHLQNYNCLFGLVNAYLLWIASMVLVYWLAIIWCKCTKEMLCRSRL